MDCIMSFMIGGTDGALDKKVSDTKMTTADNPLAVGGPDPMAGVKAANMRRLMQDAKMRKCPYNGHVYSGIMDMRYTREE